MLRWFYMASFRNQRKFFSSDDLFLISIFSQRASIGCRFLPLSAALSLCDRLSEFCHQQSSRPSDKGGLELIPALLWPKAILQHLLDVPLLCAFFVPTVIRLSPAIVFEQNGTKADWTDIANHRWAKLSSLEHFSAPLIKAPKSQNKPPLPPLTSLKMTWLIIKQVKLHQANYFKLPIKYHTA